MSMMLITQQNRNSCFLAMPLVILVQLAHNRSVGASPTSTDVPLYSPHIRAY